MNKILNYAKTKTIAGFAGMKFEQPVTVLRLALATLFFLVQWSAYAAIVQMLGGYGIINTLLSFAAALAVTYKLLRYLKLAKKVAAE